LKAISGKHLASIARKRGWKFGGARGSHHKYISPDGKTVVHIPIHGNKDLRKGTQSALMKQMGLEDKDL